MLATGAQIMQRIIVERRENCLWAASWLDQPTCVVHSGSPTGAAAKLLVKSKNGNISASDLQIDPMASGPDRVEFVVLPRNPK